MNGPLYIFLFGMLGSVAVELVKLLSLYEAGKSSLPARYRKWRFWIVRVLIAVTGGLLALAHNVQTPILAVHIGAATPVIIESFARRPTEDETEPQSSIPGKQPPG